MRPSFIAVVLAGVVIGAASMAAHHSRAAVYREHERITIVGELVTLVYRNPHSFLHVKAPDRDAQPRVWAVESGPGRQLREIQSAAGLAPGDRVVVTGDPGRDAGAWRIRLRTIERPRDGWRWTEAAR
jgi:hypothetical protein